MKAGAGREAAFKDTSSRDSSSKQAGAASAAAGEGRRPTAAHLSALQDSTADTPTSDPASCPASAADDHHLMSEIMVSSASVANAMGSKVATARAALSSRGPAELQLGTRTGTGMSAGMGMGTGTSAFAGLLVEMRAGMDAGMDAGMNAGWSADFNADLNVDLNADLGADVVHAAEIGAPGAEIGAPGFGAHPGRMRSVYRDASSRRDGGMHSHPTLYHARRGLRSSASQPARPTTATAKLSFVAKPNGSSLRDASGMPPPPTGIAHGGARPGSATAVAWRAFERRAAAERSIIQGSAARDAAALRVAKGVALAAAAASSELELATSGTPAAANGGHLLYLDRRGVIH